MNEKSMLAAADTLKALRDEKSDLRQSSKIYRNASILWRPS